MKIIKKCESEYSEYYCDICNEKILGRNQGYFYYEDEENYNYGDCGFYRTYHYDICEKCIKQVLFPYIKRKAKKEPRIEEREW